MTTAFAVIAWVITDVATVSHLLGNPTAINGMVGGAIMAVVLTMCAVLDR